MLPYFKLQTIYLGPIPIQVWGLMVAIGILAAIFLAAKTAAKAGLDKNKIWDASFGMVLFAFLGARLVHVFGYSWEFYAQNLAEIFKIWHGGLSSTGGLIAALLYFLYFVRRQRLDFWLYSDAIAYGFPLGYAIGRIGCFLIHDHPGTLSDFVLAVKYPEGARHDLGLYLSISSALMFLILVGLKKWAPKAWFSKKGFITSLVFVWYGLSRFFLDFLRATDLPGSDPRYFGLTIAQYFGIGLILVGVYNLVNIFYGKAQNKSV